MTTYRMPQLSELEDLDRIPEYVIGYLNADNRGLFYDRVLGEFMEAKKRTGLTGKELAERIGMNPTQLTRCLRNPTNWTLDTLNELLLLSGAKIRDIEILRFSEYQPVKSNRPRQALDVEDMSALENEPASRTGSTSAPRIYQE